METRFRYYLILLKQSVTNWLVVALLLFGIGYTFGQEVPGEKNKIFLIGQVVNNINGAPIENQEMMVTSDTTFEPGFPYSKKILTDKEGYYYDTIITPNQKGALKVYTYDYLNDYHDSTVYFRFNWSEDNILFAHFKLPVEPMANNYQANFYFQKDPSGMNYLDYQFNDITNSEDIISWMWDFDDGHFSTAQNPFHTYDEAGLYRVKLTVKISTSSLYKPIVTSIVKIINVTAKSYFHMGGHVFADYFPIDIGEVYLYKIDQNEVEPIDTAIFSGEYGFYIFPQVIEGEYFIKADLHYTSEYFNQFLSTYYSNKLHWKEADTIFNYVTNWEYNIALVPNTKLMAGPGKISGNISFGSDAKNPIGPACYVEIILYDDENHLVDVCHSNKEGLFELNSLDLQSYSVYAEVTGKHTIPLQIELDETQPEITFVNLTIGDFGVHGSVSAGLNDNILDNYLSQAYPNPAINQISIDVDPLYNNDLSYILFDRLGRSLSNESISPNEATYLLDISDLTPGLYFIRVEGGTNQAIRKFIKK